MSPCYLIIGMHNKYRVPFYFCKLHRDIENIYLQSIEHHCKFSNPDFHKRKYRGNAKGAIKADDKRQITNTKYSAINK